MRSDMKFIFFKLFLLLFLESNCQTDLIWLKNNCEPWVEVEKKWNNTSSYRDQLLKKDVDISEFLIEFPIIRNPLGHSLIALDFKRKFPENCDKIYFKFEPVFESLLKIKQKNLTPADTLMLEIIREKNVNQESKHVLMINLMVSLLPMKSSNKKSLGNWHPTLNDVKEGIVTQIKVKQSKILF